MSQQGREDKIELALKPGCLLLAVLILWISGGSLAYAAGPDPAQGRLVQLTLSPDYEDGTIRFDGTAMVLDGSAGPVDLAGLPLQVEQEWQDETQKTWNIIGTITEGKITYDPERQAYRLLIGPVSLNPRDELRFTFPFVNLDYRQISPPPDPPDRPDEIWRRFTHRFTYKAGTESREITALTIPFTPIKKQIDLVLTPLIGEAIVGRTDGLRFSGSVVFESLQDYEEFSRHCQSTSSRLRNGDYRTAHLLSVLDNPHYSGFAAINPAYQFKPVTVGLRSELLSCEYNQSEGVGSVIAIFSGRVFRQVVSGSSFPQPLRETDSPDGNYSFDPLLPFKGVQGYELQFGKIALAPGDVLTITVPYVHLQADVLDPYPTRLTHPSAQQGSYQEQIVYDGPKLFNLSLKYEPETRLLLSQFPAILRPGMRLIESQFDELFSRNKSLITWIILAAALLLLVVSNKAAKDKMWIGCLAWLLGGVGLLYGFKGAFGLVFIALAMFLSQAIGSQQAAPASPFFIKEIVKGLAGGGLIVAAMILNDRGVRLFRDLSTPDLSPLTPVILVVLMGLMFFLLYGWPLKVRQFEAADVPVLAFFLVILATYDVFDQSLLALIVVGLAGLYFVLRLGWLKKQEDMNLLTHFGEDLHKRLNLAFVNKPVLPAILILIIFAMGHDLTSTYANELYVTKSWIAAPLLPPLLILVSVTLTFASTALLFILLYPFIPFQPGYIKAVLFTLFLFLIFLFGVGTDDRLIASLPAVMVGRAVYYLSIPMLIGIYFDIHDFRQKENQRRASEEEPKGDISFQAAGLMRFERLQATASAIAGIVSIIAPPVYAFLFNQPVIITYFSLLEKLVLLPL